MAKFEIAFNLTNDAEGKSKVSLHPDDNGNWTGGKKGMGQLIGSKFGVAAPTLSGYLKRVATVFDMANLTLETAKDIARKGYWNPIRGDEILDQEEANRIYDTSYNKYYVTAIKITQEALGVPITGKMDNLTLNKLNNKS